MEHHHHQIDDESNEIVSTIVSEIVDDEESHLKVVKQYQITDRGDDDDDEDDDEDDDDENPTDDSNGSGQLRISSNSRNRDGILSSDRGKSSNGSLSKTEFSRSCGYKQKYKKLWEIVPELKDWLLPLIGDPYSAFCKFCQCKLHAHKKGLLSHAKSTKHKRSASHVSEVNEVSVKKVSTPRLATSLPLACGIKRSVFNDKWLNHSCFKPWLRKVPNNDTKAYCCACRSILVAGKSELIKHSLAAKHRRAVEQGHEHPLTEPDLEWLSSVNRSTAGRSSSLTMSLTTEREGGDAPSDDYAVDGLNLEDVIQQLNSVTPLHLAEEWDNVGLLVKPTRPPKIKNVLITNDLTESVLHEAIEKRVNLIISYHPPIFRPLKRLAGNSWKENVITTCIESKMAIYSPHTALDAIKGGINDWLIESFGELSDVKPITQSSCDPQSESHFSNCLDLVSGAEVTAQLSNIENIVLTVKNTEYNTGGCDVRVCCNDDTLPKVYDVVAQHPMTQICSRLTKLIPPPLPGVGMGRLGKLYNEITIREVIQKLKERTGINEVRLGLSPKHTPDTKISTIAVCAGSGHSIVNRVKADVIVTGEMSHHEVLDCTHAGKTVILTEHSNSERGYLSIYCNNLKTLFQTSVKFMVSKNDADPLRIA